MAIHVQCPQCGHAYQFRDHLAGQQIDCRCGSLLLIPSGPTASESQPPAVSPLPGEMAVVGRGVRVSRTTLALAGIAGLAVVALAVLGIWGLKALGILAGPEGPLAGYASPDDAFQAEKEAVARKDWKTALAAWAPESRDRMVGWWALAAVEAARVDPQVRPLLARHGVDLDAELKKAPAAIPLGLVDPTRFLDPAAFLEPRKLLDPKALLNPKGWQEVIRKADERSRGLAAAIRDKPEFYADLRDYLETAGSKLEEKAGLPKIISARLLADSRLTDVVIEGDTARGQRVFSLLGRSFKPPVHFRRIDGRWYKSLELGTSSAAVQQ